MKRIDEILCGVKTTAIAGHVRPDGDCTGSCMGLYLYLKENYPQIQVDVYLEEVRPEYDHISKIDQAKCICDEEKKYDLLIILDASSKDRVGVAASLLDTAAKTVCIDHHVTNLGYCMVNHVSDKASSSCEVLFDLLDEEKISSDCAAALYTGIVTDTGVFQYSCTSPHTMRVAAKLMEMGIPFSKIIDRAFFQKTYEQNQLMGRTLMESIMILDKRCIIGIVRQRELDFYGLTPGDMDGIVNQLKNTKGVHVALFLYELKPQVFKVSMRSDELVDVSSIAAVYGGGGHVRAAGCTMTGSPYDVINNISLYIEKQLLSHEGKNA
ncbi:MAG: bifunctional oligoribonuclease/PAP phosphatase NrnA [Fusicatenibacter sp.]|nr:bifunctional oligoribonuclease/PAP phosphatase NrnA [Fusicatenibacter sp.]